MTRSELVSKGMSLYVCNGKRISTCQILLWYTEFKKKNVLQIDKVLITITNTCSLTSTNTYTLFF